jgi:hypothetical protein
VILGAPDCGGASGPVCRFGWEYVQAALAAQDRALVAVDSAEVDDDLVRDMTEILTSMCAGFTENVPLPTTSGVRSTLPLALMSWRPDGAF